MLRRWLTPKTYWTAMLAAAVLFTLFPAIDLTVSRWFFTPGIPLGFELSRIAPFVQVHRAIQWVIAATVVLTLLLALRRAAGWGRGPSLRAMLFVLLSIAIGPGLVANVLLKDNWGRARPNQIAEFNGADHARFTTPLVPTDQCDNNCSFVAGDGSAGFSLLAPALAMPPAVRPAAIVIAVAAGVLFGANRIAMGGHFLSDVVFSGLITWGLVWLVYQLVMVPGGTSRARSWVSGAVRWATAPKRQVMRWLAAFGAAILVLAAVADLPIARWAHGFDPGVTRLFATTSQLGVGTGYLLAFALAGLVCAAMSRVMGGVVDAGRRWRSYMHAAWFALAGAAVAGLANDALKLVVGRLRPKLYFERGLAGLEPGHLGADYQSFPSGHSAMAFGVATVLTALWPRHAAAYYLLALLVAVSRVLGGAHWLTDVLGGATVGVLTVLWMRRVWRTHGADPAQAIAGTAQWRWAPGWGADLVTGARSCVGRVRWLGFWLDDSDRVRNGRFPAE